MTICLAFPIIKKKENSIKKVRSELMNEPLKKKLNQSKKAKNNTFFYYLIFYLITYNGQIRNWISIDERPEIVKHITRIGDWEIDAVIGQHHQGALVTIVDRVSKFTLIKKVNSKHADDVTVATITLLTPYLDKILTITADNGKGVCRS